MSHGQVRNLFKYILREVFLSFLYLLVFALFSCVFCFSFLGRSPDPSCLGKMTPHPYSMPSISLPCPSQLSLHPRTGWHALVHFGFCQSRVRSGQSACDVPAALGDRWRLPDAVLMCFSSVSPFFRPFFRARVLIPISLSNPKHSGLADDCCGTGGRGSAGVLWRRCACL